MNELSVVIPTKDRPQYIVNCLESILAQSFPPDEIVVVDGSETKDLNSELKSRFGEKTNIKYVHARPGLTRQRNVGIKASSGDIVLFLDDDVVLNRDYIEQVMHVFNTHAGGEICAVTGCRIEETLSPMQRILESVSQLLATIFCLTRRGNGKFQPSGLETTIRQGNTDKIVKVEFSYGSNMAFRREILDEFQFDEKLSTYMFMEDTDFGYRVSRKYPIYWTPNAKLLHPGLGTRGNEYRRVKNTIKNHFYLFKKNVPQTAKNKITFYWSVVGMFVTEMLREVVARSRFKGGVRGLISGLIDVIKRGKDIGKGWDNE